MGKDNSLANHGLLFSFRGLLDERLGWLKNFFLKFLSDWKASIEMKPGNHTKVEKEKMFVSKQTHIDVQKTVFSIIECIRFLLNNGMPFDRAFQSGSC